MESKIKLFITFNVIILSSNIRGSTTKQDSAVHLYLQEGSQVKLGRGDDPNDVPIIECVNFREQLELNCTLNIRSVKGNCNLVLPADVGIISVEVESLYQFADNKVIIIWQQLQSDVKSLTRQITTVNADNCTNTVTLTFPKNRTNWYDLQVIVLYKDGFDVIIAHREGRRTRISYELRGNKIGTSSVPAGLTQHGYGDKQVKDVLTFVNDDFKEQMVTCTQDKFNTICAQFSGNDSKSFFCVQMGGNQPMYRQELQLPENTQIIGVRNFNEGGMILFGLEHELKLIAVEMRLSHRPKILSVKLKWPINKFESAIIDFREKRNNLHFTLIGETYEFNHCVVMQFFKLIDKNTKNYRKRS